MHPRIRRLLLIIRIVLAVLSSHKMRTALAVMGVLLGTMSVVLVGNLAISLQKKVLVETDRFGERVLTVTAGQLSRRGRARVFGSAQSMTLKDARMIDENITLVTETAPYVTSSAILRHEGNNISTSLIGGSANIFGMKSMTVASGRAFTEAENDASTRVVVLGSEVAAKLFDNDDPVGQNILIYRAPFTVIGVLEEKGTDPTGVSLDDLIVMPLKTLMRRTTGQDYISGVLARISAWDDAPAATEAISALLRKNHRLAPGAPDDFGVFNPVDARQTEQQMLQAVSLLGRITAAISYLIGGIGIFSIMILVVNQRTVEIGIKRAVGARRRDILAQFLIESAFIGFLGGVVGGVLGIVVSYIVFAVGGFPAALSIIGVITAFVSASGIGILAGAYPASVASRINPVRVLTGN